MPVELSIVQTMTELDLASYEVVLDSVSAPGPAGAGVPAGGTTGQGLVKSSDADFDTEWGTIAGGSDDQTAAEVPFTPAGGIAATDTQAAVEEVAADAAAALSTHAADTTAVHGIADTSALETASGAQAKVDTHVNDPTAAHAASAISITDTGGDFTATDVEGALAELQSDAETDAANLAAHLADATAAHAASAIGYAGGTGMSATDVEAAVDELATEKANAADVPTNATFNAHASRHVDGGADEITTALDPRAYPLLAATLANRPAFGVAGRFFWTTDEHIVYRDTGTAWAKVAVADYADLDGTPATFAPSMHASSHQDGGADEISIQGLAGTSLELTNHLSDATDAHAASAISIADVSDDFIATDVEGALAELQTAFETQPRTISVLLTDPLGADLTTGDGKAYWRVPAAFNGQTITAVAASVWAASSSGLVTVQVRNVTDAVDVLSTALTIDASEKDSSTATTPAVINTANDDLATADQIAFDVDGAGTGVKGLLVELTVG